MGTSNSVEIDELQLYRMQVRQLKDYAIFFIDLAASGPGTRA